MHWSMYLLQDTGLEHTQYIRMYTGSKEMVFSKHKFDSENHVFAEKTIKK